MSNKNLVIRNTEPRQYELPNVKPEHTKAGKLKSAGFVAYRLLPGENDVPEELWNAVKGNPGVKIAIACKTLVNMGEGKAKSILAGLDNLSPDIALRHIGNCENVKLLNEWRGNTENLGLRKAIEERVLELVANADGDATPADTGAGATLESEDGVDAVVEAALED